VELFIIRVKLAIYYFLHFNTVRQVAARLRAKSAIYNCLVAFGASGGTRKISLPGHNRGTIISNGAHAITPIIMTNILVGGALT